MINSSNSYTQTHLRQIEQWKTKTTKAKKLTATKRWIEWMRAPASPHSHTRNSSRFSVNSQWRREIARLKLKHSMHFKHFVAGVLVSLIVSKAKINQIHLLHWNEATQTTVTSTSTNPLTLHDFNQVEKLEIVCNAISMDLVANTKVIRMWFVWKLNWNEMEKQNRKTATAATPLGVLVWWRDNGNWLLPPFYHLVRVRVEF